MAEQREAPDSEEDLCVEDDQGNKWDHAGEEKPRPVCVISIKVEEISRRDLETERTHTDEGMRDSDCNTFQGRYDKASAGIHSTLGLV